MRQRPFDWLPMQQPLKPSPSATISHMIAINFELCILALEERGGVERSVILMEAEWIKMQLGGLVVVMMQPPL